MAIFRGIPDWVHSGTGGSTWPILWTSPFGVFSSGYSRENRDLAPAKIIWFRRIGRIWYSGQPFDLLAGNLSLPQRVALTGSNDLHRFGEFSNVSHADHNSKFFCSIHSHSSSRYVIDAIPDIFLFGLTEIFQVIKFPARSQRRCEK